MNLKKLQKQVEEIGATLEPDDDWLPVLIMDCQDKCIVVGLAMGMDSEQAKDAVAGVITSLISIHKPDSACFVSTAWALLFEPGDEELYKAGLLNRPSENKNRKEVVIAVCMGVRGESDGEAVMIGHIERSEGPPRISKWDVTPGAYTSGRFSEAMQKGFGIEGKQT